MRILLRYIAVFMLLGVISISCSNSHEHSEESEEIPALDSAVPVDEVDSISIDTVTVANFDDMEFQDGIIPVIQRECPEYAERLSREGGDGFVVVDKASMRVILYDKYGMEQRAYDMACAKNYGTKHAKGDSRTPEGFFSVEGIYDSTDWLFTDDNGVTSKKKGQFGPRFIRLKIPTTSQIGIHGTCSPWSIGHRTSHGCIRILNENILELVNLVKIGMPVIVLPGKRDRKVNREEGYDIPYFPTAPKYAAGKNESSPGSKIPLNDIDSVSVTLDSIKSIKTEIPNDSLPSQNSDRLLEDNHSLDINREHTF